MKIAIIKRINEKLPYWMKRPFTRMIRNRLVENSVFQKQYELLIKADNLSKDDIQREQFRLLKNTLGHAYEHTVYYRKLFDSLSLKPEDIRSVNDLSKLPVLTKQNLAEHYLELQADDITDFYEVSTGGTTGKPTHLMMERDAIYREWAFAYHFWAKYGYDYRTSRIATLRGVSLGKQICEVNPLYQELRLNLFLMNHDNISKYVRAVEKYGADFIYGYPSAVYNFCRLAREAGIVLTGKFKAALLISENLYPFQEKEITDTLGCPIAIFYGHSERAVFAEKNNKGYVFQPLYGIAEIASNNTLIVTGFINGKMPLIRYEVDDQAIPVTEGEIEITGHWNADLLEGIHGEQISAAAINFHDETFEGVEKYQFVQQEAGRCILNVVPSAGTLDEAQVKRIEKHVQQKFRSALICKVEVVHEIEMSARGKYKMVIKKSGGVLIQSKAYNIIGHRDQEVLYGARGEQISVAAINFHDNTFDLVEGYQFIQMRAGYCTLNIVPLRTLSDKQIKTIQHSVASKLASAIECEVKIVQHLQLSPRGKYKMVLQSFCAGDSTKSFPVEQEDK